MKEQGSQSVSLGPGPSSSTRSQTRATAGKTTRASVRPTPQVQVTPTTTTPALITSTTPLTTTSTAPPKTMTTTSPTTTTPKVVFKPAIPFPLIVGAGSTRGLQFSQTTIWYPDMVKVRTKALNRSLCVVGKKALGAEVRAIMLREAQEAEGVVAKMKDRRRIWQSILKELEEDSVPHILLDGGEQLEN